MKKIKAFKGKVCVLYKLQGRKTRKTDMTNLKTKCMYICLRSHQRLPL